MDLDNIVNKAWNHLTSFGNRLVSPGRTAAYATVIGLALAGGVKEARAVALCFEDDPISVNTKSTATFIISGDDATSGYIYYVGNEPGLAEVTSMERLPGAGDYPIIIPLPNGYWKIETKDRLGIPGIPAQHFRGTVTAGGTTGTYAVYMFADDFGTVLDILTVDIVPKPATIYYVNQGQSIQNLINDPNVVDRDVIIAAPGRYIENINFNGKNITLTSTDPNDSDIVANTILDGNDVGSVVTFENGEDPNCVLSGFTITNGNAERGGGIYSRGSNPTVTNCIISSNSADQAGGIYYRGNSPTVTNCIVTGNSANLGGGISSEYSSPTLTNCTFSGNSANDYSGGGMSSQIGSPTLTNCTFSGNSANYSGGGLFNWASSSTLINCIFSENSADDASGGGIASLAGSATISGCTFSGNSAKYGGGMRIDGGSVTNSIFHNNSAEEEGGGVFIYPYEPITLTNCIISGNSAQAGGGIYMSGRDKLTTIKNSILWDNTAPNGAEIALEGGVIFNPTYCDIAGGQDNIDVRMGAGNIDADPYFVDPNNNDYRLKSQAGRYDPNTRTWVKDDVTSPCIDAGNPMSPIMYEPFPNGGIINMGAYGGTSEASKSYFGKPPCEIIVAGDVNGDCLVNFLDFRLMALHWCEDNNP